MPPFCWPESFSSDFERTCCSKDPRLGVRDARESGDGHALDVRPLVEDHAARERPHREVARVVPEEVGAELPLLARPFLDPSDEERLQRLVVDRLERVHGLRVSLGRASGRGSLLEEPRRVDRLLLPRRVVLRLRLGLGVLVDPRVALAHEAERLPRLGVVRVDLDHALEVRASLLGQAVLGAPLRELEVRGHVVRRELHDLLVVALARRRAGLDPRHVRHVDLGLHARVGRHDEALRELVAHPAFDDLPVLQVHLVGENRARREGDDRGGDREAELGHGVPPGAYARGAFLDMAFGSPITERYVRGPAGFPFSSPALVLKVSYTDPGRSVHGPSALLSGTAGAFLCDER
ncbi:hypothetical protein HY251_14740 [bacterium]|nr:hypothetical protein [bacterium]